MKINTNQVLKSFNGETVKDMVNGEAVDATVKTALVNAILAPSQKDVGMDKIKKYELAKAIYSNDEIELTAEEIEFCKKAVDAAYPSPLIVGLITDVLEG